MNLNLIREDDRYLWCLCSNHNDVRTPNLCINKTEINGKPKGYGYCYACGYRIDIPSEDVDEMSKLKTVCWKPTMINWDELNRECQLRTFVKGKYRELEKEWNVVSLLNYGVGWDDESHTFPMRNESGMIIGILRRFPCGGKLCVPGSQLGLFIPNKPVTQVAICEGLSDAAMIVELGFWGLGLPSASFGHDMAQKFLDNQNYSGKVVIIADADEAGKKSAGRMKNVLTSEYKCVIIEPETGKDLRDFVNIKGKQYVKRWVEKNL